MAGYTGSIPLTGFIAPTDTADTYPVIDPLFGIDGFRNVPTETDMNNIPFNRRRQGMVVGCNGSGIYYKLLPGPWTGTITDWNNFITSPLAGNVSRTQYLIAGGSVSIPQNYQYLVYGGLIIGASGSLQNDGRVIIINGTLSFVGNGTYSGAGTLTYLTDFSRYNDLTGPVPNWNATPPSVKYSASFSSTANVPLTITHGLGTTDIVYSVRENNNFITSNIQINDLNSVILTTDATIINGRINIIG
jgi:hypothetical protein